MHLLIKNYNNIEKIISHKNIDIWDYVNSLIHLAVKTDLKEEYSITNEDIGNKLLLLANKAKNRCDKYYILANVNYMKKDYNSYLKYIEKYAKSVNLKDYTYNDLYYDFLYIWDNVTDKDNTIFDINSLNKDFHNIVKKYSEGSAIEMYMKYLCTNDYFKWKIRELLNNIRDIDPIGWYIADIHLGDIYYYDDKDYKSAYEAYKSIIYYNIDLSEFDWCADFYFLLAYSAGEVKDYDLAVKSFKKCIKIEPNYEYASTNLGYYLLKQNKYKESIKWHDKGIEIDSKDFRPYRNKFEALLKLNMIEEIQELISKYPQHFKTKYYKEKIRELSKYHSIKEVESKKTSDNDVDLIIDIEKELLKETENKNAGTIFVSNIKSNIDLYSHQQEAIRKMNKEILNKDNYSGLLVLPTGAGKTLTAVYWIIQNILDKDKKILWIAHRHELLNQAKKTFERICCRDISKNKNSYNFRIISGGHDKPVHIKQTDDIIIASRASIKRGINYLIENWVKPNRNNIFMVIDEAHHAISSEYRLIINSIKENIEKFKLLGLTATPFRTADDEKGLLSKIFVDGIVHKTDLRELINLGILSEPKFISIPTNFNMVNFFEENKREDIIERIATDNFFDIDNIGGDLAKLIAQNGDRNKIIVKQYAENKEIYGQTIVFAQGIDLAIALNKIFQEEGIKSDFIVSGIKDIMTGMTRSNKINNKIIQKFRNKELEVIINVDIMTEGTDIPETQSVFLTRPTKSKILMTQMIGRALRGVKAGGTKEAYIVSFIDDWEDKIAWVNPEQLYIDENINFREYDTETQKQIMRIVSIKKIEEFAKIINDTIDERITNIDFIERIPIGIYKFSYFIERLDGDDIDKSCNILVFDCMKDSYNQLMEWLPKADLSNINYAVEHINNTLFGEKDRLLGYNKRDIEDIIMYYKQTGEIPSMIDIRERKDYDIRNIAQKIIDNPLGKREIIDEEWNKNNNKWSAFLGIDNQKLFRKLIGEEIEKIEYPEDYIINLSNPITEKEQIKIKDLSLIEIRELFPALDEKIRTAVFKKYTDNEGYYFSASGNYRSKNKLDFQIDHIKPMAHGGKTVLDNLQLLTRKENAIKSDTY